MSKAKSSLEIRLFGHFQVRINGQLVDERSWQRRKARTLIKILALQPHHQLNREQVAEMLSPNLDANASCNSLNKNLHAARRAFEPQLKRGAASQFILTRGQQIVLRADELRIDVDEFERCAEAALKNKTPQEFEAALAHYTDDLLLEDLYEDWLTTKRERLRLLRKRLMSELAALYESQKNFERAIYCLNLLTGIDGTDEAAHRRLMQLYAVSDNRSLAVQQYKLCVHNLRVLLDAKPDSETDALYQHILSLKSPLPVSPESKNRIIEPLAQLVGPASPIDQMVGQTLNRDAGKMPHNKAGVTPQPINSDSLIAQVRYLLPLGMAVLMLITAGVLKYRWHHDSITSMVVLPCENATGDSTFEYLADGMSETLMRNLSRLPRLRVVARHTAFQYKGQMVEPRQLADDLQVEAVLLGKLIDRRGQPFLKLDLFDVEKNAIIWSETRQFDADDVYELERQMEASLVKVLRPQTDDERDLVDRSKIMNSAAYAAYLKGLYYWNRRQGDDLKLAVDHFQEATDLDPLFALAYAGLATAYVFGGGVEPSPVAFMPRAKLCAQKALELDDGIAEAHTALAFIAQYYEWDFVAAEKEYHRAIELNPNYALAHHWYGEYLAFMGNHDAALGHIFKAQELDPRSVPIARDVGVILHYARQYDRAIEQFQKMTTDDDQNGEPYAWLTLLYLENGKPEFAKQAFQHFDERANPDARDATRVSMRANYFALSGDRRLAFQELEKLKRLDPTQHCEWAIAQILAILNEKDEAFRWLDRVYANRGGGIISLKTNPFFDHLRSDPRFAKLLKRIGLIT